MLAQSKYDIPLRLEYSYLSQSVAIIDDYGRFASVQIAVISSRSNATWEALILSLPSSKGACLSSPLTLY